MSRLSSAQVLKDINAGGDSGAVESLVLSHRGLSEVSCLSDFKNLWRLDLKLNNLTSLLSLRLCSNLKWLSVAENKLDTLKGIEGLTKLTVLNASKNKLKSIEEVTSITTLCALILNDNEIASIPSLDRLTHLNTLVLSKNPITEIGNSLAKSNSITKLSLSHCRLRSIGTSLKSCVVLKELRLSHNDIKALPAELANNSVLLNLDLGYNAIITWSDLKVLGSLVNLRNLNLQGNPVASQSKLVKKVKTTLPKLRVFNAKPIEKHTKSKGDDTENTSLLAAPDQNLENPTVTDQSGDGNFSAAKDKTKVKKEKRRTSGNPAEDIKTTVKRKVEKKPKGKRGELDVIDDGDVSFAELIDAGSIMKGPVFGAEMVNPIKSNTGSVVTTVHKRKKAKTKTQSKVSSEVEVVEVGTGGPSTWGDE